MNENTIFPMQALPYVSRIMGGTVIETKNELQFCANSYWLENNNGDSVHCVFNGNGWTVRMQESYLCRGDKETGKKPEFNHHNDISGFNLSGYPIDTVKEQEWSHVFESPAAAITEYMNWKHRLYEDD